MQKKIVVCLRALLIRKGVKLLRYHHGTILGLRALLIRKGVKP